MKKKNYTAPAIETIKLYAETPLATSLYRYDEEATVWSLNNYEEESNSLTNDEIWGKEW